MWKEKSLPRLIYIVFGAHRKIKAIQCFQKANAAGALHTGTTAPRSHPHCFCIRALKFKAFMIKSSKVSDSTATTRI